MCDRVIVLSNGHVEYRDAGGEAEEQTLLQSMHRLVKAEDLA